MHHIGYQLEAIQVKHVSQQIKRMAFGGSDQMINKAVGSSWWKKDMQKQGDHFTAPK